MLNGSFIGRCFWFAHSLIIVILVDRHLFDAICGLKKINLLVILSHTILLYVSILSKTITKELKVGVETILHLTLVNLWYLKCSISSIFYGVYHMNSKLRKTFHWNYETIITFEFINIQNAMNFSRKQNNYLIQGYVVNYNLFNIYFVID